MKKWTRYAGRLLVVTAVMWMGFGAGGQEFYASIHNVGEATVEARPDNVDFWLTREFTADTMQEAMAEAAGFEQTVVETLNQNGVSPHETLVGEKRPVDAALPLVQRFVRIRFQHYAFRNPEDGMEQFAEVCDGVRQVAEDLDASLEGPYYDVVDRASVEQTAVNRAMEEAYPLANSAAQLMQGRIRAVDHVEILEISWERPMRATEEALQERMICLARVRVTYAFDDTD